MTGGADFRNPPRRRREAEQYGYDSDGRLIVSWRYPSGVRYDSQVVDYEGHVALARGYHGDVTGRIEYVSRYVTAEDDKVVLAEHARPGRNWMYWLERFAYDARGRLCTVDFERIDADAESTQMYAYARGTQRLHYADDQLVSVIEEYASGAPPRVLYAPVPDNVDELVEVALTGVLEAIRRAAAQSQPDEPMCLLALRYVPGGPPLPPIVNLCPDALWDQLVHDQDDPGYVLNPAEWRIPEVVLDLDARTASACAVVEQWQQRQPKPDLARQLAVTAASILQDDDWRERRAVTDDFLVYAVDVELQDLEANLPRRRPERFRALGLDTGAA